VEVNYRGFLFFKTIFPILLRRLQFDLRRQLRLLGRSVCMAIPDWIAVDASARGQSGILAELIEIINPSQDKEE
jgi:hypothetical protein